MDKTEQSWSQLDWNVDFITSNLLAAEYQMCWKVLVGNEKNEHLDFAAG